MEKFGKMFSGQDSTNKETSNAEKREKFIKESPFSLIDKIDNFPKYASRQSITKFLCKEELFRKILNVDGSIVECGVLFGGGLFTWAQLSAIFEPVNYTRKVIGFDTFEGFKALDDKDSHSKSIYAREGGLAVDAYDDICSAMHLYDENRNIGHIQKIEIIKGDAVETIPIYLEKNPHLVVSLLYLDFDVYKPTKAALSYFLERMPKGAILAFDELNNPHWPGETCAVADVIGIHNLAIKRFSYNSYISYAVL